MGNSSAALRSFHAMYYSCFHFELRGKVPQFPLTHMGRKLDRLYVGIQAKALCLFSQIVFRNLQLCTTEDRRARNAESGKESTATCDEQDNATCPPRPYSSKKAKVLVQLRQ